MNILQQQTDRGTKRVCIECAARFFDLGRSSTPCPKCGCVFVPPEPAPNRAIRVARKPFARRTAYESQTSSHDEKEAEAEHLEPGPDEESATGEAATD